MSLQNIRKESTPNLQAWLKIHENSKIMRMLSYSFHQIVFELYRRDRNFVATEYFYIQYINPTCTVEEYMKWKNRTGRSLYHEY